MLLRRLILILSILAMLPTAVDPSCVGYFIYSPVGWSVPVSTTASVDASNDPSVTDVARPTEGLAARRVSSPVSIAPQAFVDLSAALFAVAPGGGTTRRVEHSPAFLASSLRRTFLRNAVLLI